VQLDKDCQLDASLFAFVKKSHDKPGKQGQCKPNQKAQTAAVATVVGALTPALLHPPCRTCMDINSRYTCAERKVLLRLAAKQPAARLAQLA
jgi:hypothetical protein